MSNDRVIAARYSKALLELACQIKCDEQIEAELENLSAALKANPSLESFLANPSLKLEQRKRFVDRLYPTSKADYYRLWTSFLMLLFERQRFALIHEIAISFKEIADEAQGQAVAELTSAVELDAETEQSIVRQVEKMAGYKLFVRKQVDPSLIGGVMVRVRNKVIDGSVKSRIESVKKLLTQSRTV